MSESGPADQTAGSQGSSPQVLVGSRFRLESLLSHEGANEIYRATDISTGVDAAVRLSPPPAAPQARTGLEADLGKVARVAHRNLASVIAFGLHEQRLFVASELEKGHSLRQLIDAKAAQGGTVGATAAHTLLGHVATGLSEAYKVMAHGAVNPGCIWVSASGRVQVMDLGLARGLPAVVRRGAPMGAPDAVYVAPELTRGGQPSASSDAFALGVVLYELLTGRLPTDSVRAPSQVTGNVPPAVDLVVARALSPNPAGRFATPSDLVKALGSALTPATQIPAPTPGGPRLTMGRSFNVAQASGLGTEEARWLLQKDKLDYGPFSLQQAMAQIERGAFNAEHIIVDIDSGARQKIKDHPQLGEFAMNAERSLESVRRAQADQVGETVERKKSTATVLILGLAVVLVGVALVFYLKNRKDAEATALSERVGEADVDAFISQAKFDFAQKKRSGGGTRRGGSKDDPFNTAMNLGDVSQGGADEVLSDNTVQRVMMQNYRSLVPCIMEEKRRSAGLSDVEMEFLILGSGKVSAVKVNGQRNGGFPSCVLGRMQRFPFPKFNGRQTIASWSMSMK